MRIASPIFVGTLLPLLLLAAPGVPAQEPGLDEAAPDAPLERSLDPLRRGAPLTEEPPAAPMARVENFDLRRERGWPEQPPTIPHTTDGYQVDRNFNRCMSCHARANAERFQAPMVSVTHFMDRDGQVLAQLSARRYFCTQCHVPQTDARLLIENDYKTVEAVIDAGQDR